MNQRLLIVLYFSSQKQPWISTDFRCFLKQGEQQPPALWGVSVPPPSPPSPPMPPQLPSHFQLLLIQPMPLQSPANSSSAWIQEYYLLSTPASVCRLQSGGGWVRMHLRKWLSALKARSLLRRRPRQRRREKLSWPRCESLEFTEWNYNCLQVVCVPNIFGETPWFMGFMGPMNIFF